MRKTLEIPFFCHKNKKSATLLPRGNLTAFKCTMGAKLIRHLLIKCIINKLIIIDEQWVIESGIPNPSLRM